ncbi:hypothetical protein POM88_036234 [Heracleum sosnowskyi]|uniref:Replication factor A C-terminal domain-containing protein n=1 Tax=Heracleum sosnowskyi TaxID=360622 RepID=A0AAD8MEP7_9APIA|nr:hypothetical protein POM88_036234 [Heracleum sosnowskyi]
MVANILPDVIAGNRRVKHNEKRRERYKERKLQSVILPETIEQIEERNKKRRQRYQDIQENPEEKEKQKKKRRQTYEKAIEAKTIEQREGRNEKRICQNVETKKTTTEQGRLVKTVEQRDKRKRKLPEKNMDQMVVESLPDVIAENLRVEYNKKRRERYKESKLQSVIQPETIEQIEERNKKRRQRYQDIQENLEEKEKQKKKRRQTYEKENATPNFETDATKLIVRPPPKFAGKTVLWSSDSTQYFFNIDHPDLVELRNNCKLDENIIPAVERVEIIQLFDAELSDGESSILYTVEANIVGLLATKTDPWFYTGCDKCYTKFKNSPICTSCPITTTQIPLFRVTAEVRDSTSTTTFILFDRHVRKLITVSAQHVLTNDKNAKPNIIPAVLNNMLGKRCVFKLKLTRKNTEEKLEGYTVSDVQEIAAEEHHSATSEIVNPNAKVHHDNAEPNDHVEKKRKIATEDNSLQCSLPTSGNTQTSTPPANITI